LPASAFNSLFFSNGFLDGWKKAVINKFVNVLFGGESFWMELENVLLNS
jgi:hypothetical protein